MKIQESKQRSLSEVDLDILNLNTSINAWKSRTFRYDWMTKEEKASTRNALKERLTQLTDERSKIINN